MNKQNKQMLVFLALLANGSFTTTNAQQPSHDALLQVDRSIGQALETSKPLILKGDFSPIDDAYAKKDSNLLWGYYNGNFDRNVYQIHSQVTTESFKQATELEIARYKNIIAREAYTANYLKQLDGHARAVGALIEKSANMPATGPVRGHLFVCLDRLASDECIEQLGRFLFDERDPDFIPLPPGEKRAAMYDWRGVPRPLKDEAASSLLNALKGRFPFTKELLDEGGRLYHGAAVPGFADKLRNWWLTSPEAAPFRRSLASTGVVLPPGYPNMTELKGALTKIAPPLSNQLYPSSSLYSPEKPTIENTLLVIVSHSAIEVESGSQWQIGLLIVLSCAALYFLFASLQKRYRG